MEPVPVPEFDGQRESRQGGDAAETDEPLDDVDIRRPGGELGDRFVECVSPGLRVEHASVALVEHDRERSVLEPLLAKPRIVCPRPRGRVVHRAMAKQQLREPVAGPHQIAAGILARADQITRGLLVRPGHPHSGDLTQPQQPRQPLSIPPVGLDPIGHRRDLRRRRDNAADPRHTTGTRKPVPGRSRLVHDPNRRRQRLQPRHRPLVARRHPQRPHLTAPQIDHARDHRPSVHIKPDTATFVHNRRLP